MKYVWHLDTHGTFAGITLPETIESEGPDPITAGQQLAEEHWLAHAHVFDRPVRVETPGPTTQAWGTGIRVVHRVVGPPPPPYIVCICGTYVLQEQA